MTPVCTDYDRMTPGAAGALAGASLLPHEIRARVLNSYLKARGPRALTELFAAFIGLANSVVANNRETAEEMLLCEGMHPHEVGKINLPTIFGALRGVEVAAQARNIKGACDSCAYRLGSAANQSPATTCDVDWQADSGAPFWCHHDLNEIGEPTRLCIGHQLRLKSASERRP